MQLLPPKSGWLSGWRRGKLWTENGLFAFTAYCTGVRISDFIFLYFFQTSLGSRLATRRLVKVHTRAAHGCWLFFNFPRPATAGNSWENRRHGAYFEESEKLNWSYLTRPCREAVNEAAVWLWVPGVAFSYATCHSLLHSQICLL